MPTCSSASPKSRTLLAFRVNKGISASLSHFLIVDSGPPDSSPLKDQQVISFFLLLSYRRLQTTRFRSIKGPTSGAQKQGLGTRDFRRSDPPGPIEAGKY